MEPILQKLWLYLFLQRLIFLLTDHILSPSPDFGQQKQGQKCPAANFFQKGVCSPVNSHHFTFYDPSQYPFRFPLTAEE